jgi:uncharacterized tellurite resistance protein B-like protein
MEAEWRYLEGLFLADIIPQEDVPRLGAKGLLTVADVVRSVVETERINQMSIENFGLSTHVIRRLLAKGYQTIGDTDELSEEGIHIYISGLGEGAIGEINSARASVGKPPLRKH